ncbi:aldehyde dehydrogenase family protein [Cetobacterium somerae]|uniref:aldehyde dehydrogenase family protein n=1 Tax=Cetobacterium sp. NK01 TaxID=2993530 RepID=UPI002115EA95|nr:aldehyde dehydrogenase family protein [Cetobacterium sp. NK01]MCQ8212823.1 aldehyde dehydrogenase family protein [Cetobacterium sp. NK01]
MKNIDKIEKLKKSFEKNKNLIADALYKDLGKNFEESRLTEYYPVMSEFDYFIKNLEKWSEPEKIRSFFNFIGCGTVLQPEPYGKVLIISPWNYPFNLTFLPLIGAIAAGNEVVLKPSEYSKNSSDIIKKIIEDSALEDIEVVLGDLEETKKILDSKFDYIFFTGSSKVGKEIYLKAAENLTPVTLELGGKSPVIIEDEHCLDEAVEKIIWGKFFNRGQTCIAPDYIYLPKGTSEKFVELARAYIRKNGDVGGKIINDIHFDRLNKLLENQNIIYQNGKIDEDSKDKGVFPFTITLNPKDTDPILEEEIFGPILPLIEYESLDKVYWDLRGKPSPLALYIFRSEKGNISTRGIKAGGVCINGTMLQILDRKVPFGGIGNSGLGQYHGKYSFDTFTHYKPIFEGSSLKISTINRVINLILSKIKK